MSCKLPANKLRLYHIASQRGESLIYYELWVASQQTCELQAYESKSSEFEI